MLKRTLILLCLAGGLMLGTSIPNPSHARCLATTHQLNGSGIDASTANLVLKKAAPYFKMSTADAISAYNKGSMAIVELPHSGPGNLFDVQFEGDCVWVIVINDF